MAAARGAGRGGAPRGRAGAAGRHGRTAGCPPAALRPRALRCPAVRPHSMPLRTRWPAIRFLHLLDRTAMVCLTHSEHQPAQHMWNRCSGIATRNNLDAASASCAGISSGKRLERMQGVGGASGGGGRKVGGREGCGGAALGGCTRERRGGVARRPRPRAGPRRRAARARAAALAPGTAPVTSAPPHCLRVNHLHSEHARVVHCMRYNSCF